MHKKLFFSSSGFTLIEIMISVIIISLILGISISIYPSFQTRTLLNVTSHDLIQTLRTARSKATNGEMNSQFGVSLASDSFTLFKGAIFDPLDDYNDVHQMPPMLEITNISLGGSGSDILFSKALGVTINSGSLEIGITGGDSRVIQIYKNGNIEWNWKE